MGSKMAPKIAQKSTSAPKAAQDAPKEAQEAAKRANIGPKRGPEDQKSHENAVRKHWLKGLSRPLYARCTKGPWLTGRFGGAAPLEIRPLSLQAQRGAVERSELKLDVVADATTVGNPTFTAGKLP